MTINIETMLGIPPHPPFVRHKFKVSEPLVVETAKVVCDVFNLDPEAFLEPMLDYVVESLNKRRGHPARVIFLKIIFQTISGYVSESDSEKWHH